MDSSNQKDSIAFYYGLTKKLVSNKIWIVRGYDNLEDVEYDRAHQFGDGWEIYKNITKSEFKSRFINR